MSETYYEKFSNYYDSIHSTKDYKMECDFITKHSKNFGSLLDVGCGTLSHSLILSSKFDKVLGVDSSIEMLKVGNKKLTSNEISNVETSNKELREIDGSFDTIISMFNVVNHIDTLKDLLIFFDSISKKLNPKGTFIFDCWNSVACCIDKPHEKSTTTIQDFIYTLVCNTKTDTNLFDSVSTMETEVVIFDDFSEIDRFTYSIKHRLWAPHILKDLLIGFGFNTIDIFPKFDDTRNGNENDYRITFVCKKY